MQEKHLKHCSKCFKEKPWEDFYRDKKGVINSACRICCRAQVKASGKKHNEALKARRRKWYQNNKEKISEYQKAWIRSKDYYKTGEYLLRARAKYKRIRDAVLNAFDHKCSCCGENKREFLAIDHINNDGKQHRKKRNNLGIYRDVIKLGFPKDKFRLLCHNCNHSMGCYGYCPHKNLTT